MLMIMMMFKLNFGSPKHELQRTKLSLVFVKKKADLDFVNEKKDL